MASFLNCLSYIWKIHKHPNHQENIRHFKNKNNKHNLKIKNKKCTVGRRGAPIVLMLTMPVYRQ